MRKKSVLTRGLTAVVLTAGIASTFAACGGDKAKEAPPPSGPIVSVLELPVSLRSAAKPAADAANLEISQNEIHLAGQTVLTLNAGSAAAADRQGDQLPKLAAALAAGPHKMVALAVASGVPYDTVAAVLATAKAAGAGQIAFQVRAPGGSVAGHSLVENYEVGPKTNTDQGATFAGLTPRPWSDFATQWDAVQSGCRSSQTGSCAYKSEKVATGGELKIVLHAAGQGVNVEFFRIGPAPEDAPAAPEVAAGNDKSKSKGKGKSASAKKKKGKKVELIDGVQRPKDVVSEEENSPPATEALFQFRAQEAVSLPSAVTDTIKPVCGTTACGVVVQAEKATLFVRVISLIGAAFPDGTPAPHVRFELP
jgi:biopolymer transport protein ExbD